MRRDLHQKYCVRPDFVTDLSHFKGNISSKAVFLSLSAKKYCKTTRALCPFSGDLQDGLEYGGDNDAETVNK